MNVCFVDEVYMQQSWVSCVSTVGRSLLELWSNMHIGYGQGIQAA